MKNVPPLIPSNPKGHSTKISLGIYPAFMSVVLLAELVHHCIHPQLSQSLEQQSQPVSQPISPPSASTPDDKPKQNGVWKEAYDAGNMPKTIRIKEPGLLFREWRDLEDFNTRSYQFAKRARQQAGGKNILEISDAEAENMGKQLDAEIQKLSTQFAAAGRLWDIPVGTEINITKFYDKRGDEILPVWDETLKTFSTPDGNTVYVVGDWEGRAVYTFLPDDAMPDLRKANNGKSSGVAQSMVSKAQWKAKLIEKYKVARFGIVGWAKTEFLSLMGPPGTTQTVEGTTFWYYNCSDGKIQLELQAIPLSAVGFMQGEINDY